MAQRPRTLRRRLLERRHTALLVAIVAALAARPLIGDAPGAAFVFSLSLLGMLLVALYATQVDELLGERDVLLVERKKRRVIAWALAVPAVAGRVVLTFAPSPELYRIVSVCWLLFLAFITWSELRTLLRQREITGEAISMSVSVYLLMGLTWGLLYIMIHEYQPDAFNLGAPPAAAADFAASERHLFPIFIYFSLTTLSTIGFGDITPLTLQARYAAVAEGITGQFYLAILVARLVSMHMSQSAAQAAPDQLRTAETEASVDRVR